MIYDIVINWIPPIVYGAFYSIHFFFPLPAGGGGEPSRDRTVVRGAARLIAVYFIKIAQFTSSK